MRTEEVLEMIDKACQDPELGPDAMRWAPKGPPTDHLRRRVWPAGGNRGLNLDRAILDEVPGDESYRRLREGQWTEGPTDWAVLQEARALRRTQEERETLQRAPVHWRYIPDGSIPAERPEVVEAYRRLTRDLYETAMRLPEYRLLGTIIRQLQEDPGALFPTRPSSRS